jgi:hypothetical protein
MLNLSSFKGWRRDLLYFTGKLFRKKRRGQSWRFWGESSTLWISAALLDLSRSLSNGGRPRPRDCPSTHVRVENVISPLSSICYSTWPPPRCPRERLQLPREGKSGLLFRDEKISRVSSLDSAVIVVLITDQFVRSLVSTFPHLARV